MNIKKLSILFCFVLMAMVTSAMQYQIKVLNTPTITINGKELKVGDWFDDQAIITWSKESQAMRVLSEDNRVYTLSAKLCKEIKTKKFSDFILYTKPLAARGNDSLTLKEALEEKFDNNFIMLDEIVIDLSGVELPKNLTLYFTIKNNEDKKGKFIISKSTAKLKREVINKLNLNDANKLSLNVYIQVGQDEPILVTAHMDVEILPLKLDFKQVHNITKPTIAPEKLNAIDSLLLKAEIAYHIDANDTLACKYIEQAISFYENFGNVEGIEYAKLLSLWCKYGCDEFRNEAILKGEKALQQLKENTFPHEYAECLSSLAYCYSLTEDSLDQNGQKSVDYCLDALKYIDLTECGDLYVSTLAHLSGAYISVDKYQKAIEIADKCAIYADSCLNNIEKRTILFAKYSDTYSLALNNKAVALYCQGKYIDCLTYSKMNLQFRLNAWGKTGRYALSAYNLASIEEALGYYKEAFNHYVESYNTLIDLNQLTPSDNIERFCHFVDLEIKLGELFNARRNYAILVSLVDNFDFRNHSDLYSSFLNIAVKYWLYVGDFPEAYNYLQKSYEHNDGFCVDDDVHIQSLVTFGLDSIAYEQASTLQSYYEHYYGKTDIRSLENLPNVIKSAMAIDNWDTADSCAVSYIYGMRKHIGQMFPVMTPEDRELFFKKIDNSLFQYLPSFLNQTRREGFAKSLYDLTLLHKGLLLRAEQELSDFVKANNNEESIELYNEIIDNTARLKNEKDYDKRDSISNVLQQQLVSLQNAIPNFKNLNNQFGISWKDVQTCLNDDEIAIEFIDIIDHNTGNKSCKALVLMSDCDMPYYIDLFNETDLRNIAKEDYYTTDYLFALIWEPIMFRRFFSNKIKKIYFSASSMISQIALESLIDYQGKHISEDREFYRLSSTRELVKRDKNKILDKAVVYGGLKYDADIQELAEANKQIDIDKISTSRSTIEFIKSLNNDRAGMRYLPATKIEAELIDLELQNKGIQSTLLKDIKGTEESFISLNQDEINILHIATHGFYWSQSELDSLQTRRAISLSQLGLNMNRSYEEKALTRSGLFLSGANIALSGKEISNNICDGILTAHEISKLNFNNLDLAVLSACDTGLGDMKSGEGVLGLQRGFKKAGAKSILMTLWKVDDDATQMLMVEFYKKFLNGETKTKSLLNAQQYVKSQQGFEDPEYWAGFVLLDALN